MMYRVGSAKERMVNRMRRAAMIEGGVGLASPRGCS